MFPRDRGLGETARGGVGGSCYSELAPEALSLQSSPFLPFLPPLSPTQQLTFALIIEGTAHGHREKTEGIESSPEEETCVGCLL